MGRLVELELIDRRFRLLAAAASGGMATVWQARDEQTGARVALKLLSSTEDLRQIERAHREITLLAKLSHPAIVRHIADGMMPDGSPYVVMEWIEGPTVSGRVKSTGFSLREALAMVRGIAGALGAAHGASILHRDLKPSNILLEGDDPARPKLIDFGIARARDAVYSITRTGGAVGTPGYMSPEQARGESALTPACDVFGLGCVLYECASGKPAFSGNAAGAVLTKILLAEPPPFAAACPDAPPDVVALVERMLARRARDRPADGDAVVAAIDALAPVPDGPRRSARRLIEDKTRVGPPVGDGLHCLVAAARGSPDDILDAPTAQQYAELVTAANQWQGQLELVATGAVVVDLAGDAKDIAHRAAHLALAMRSILAGWYIAISPLVADVARAVERTNALLAHTVLAGIVSRRQREMITVHRQTAKHLQDDFDIELGELPKLRGPKTSS
ncbi:MAG TPA: serine/threonine-protein kinase [Kofleriaceae bacterium]|nr:serine/threonine-protein kinase [Kofleriaceae bacterium]